MAIVWSKYPDEVLDYQVDFTAKLDGDTIASATVTAGAGVTADRLEWSGTVVTFWLSGGAGPAMTTVAVTVATAGGRTLEHQVTLKIGG